MKSRVRVRASSAQKTMLLLALGFATFCLASEILRQIR